jgi:hypothetical protein
MLAEHERIREQCQSAQTGGGRRMKRHVLLLFLSLSCSFAISSFHSRKYSGYTSKGNSCNDITWSWRTRWQGTPQPEVDFTAAAERLNAQLLLLLLLADKTASPMPDLDLKRLISSRPWPHTHHAQGHVVPVGRASASESRAFSRGGSDSDLRMLCAILPRKEATQLMQVFSLTRAAARACTPHLNSS